MSERQAAEKRAGDALTEQFHLLIAHEIERRASQLQTAELAARIESAIAPHGATRAALADVDDDLLADYARAMIRQQTAAGESSKCYRSFREQVDAWAKLQEGASRGAPGAVPRLCLAYSRDEPEPGIQDA